MSISPVTFKTLQKAKQTRELSALSKQLAKKARKKLTLSFDQTIIYCEELLSGWYQAIRSHQLSSINACGAKNLVHQNNGEKLRWQNVQSCEQDWLFFIPHILLYVIVKHKIIFYQNA